MPYEYKAGPAHFVFSAPTKEFLRIDSVGSLFADGKEVSRRVAEDILRSNFAGEQLEEMLRTLRKHARPVN